MAKASIIITTYSRPHLLPRAIESARASGENVEIIVVDDASQDETRRLCQSIADIKYLRTDRNLGTSGARNAGIAESTGEYLSFLDDDDTRLPRSLDHQIEMLEREPSAGLIYGRALLADQHGSPTKRSYPAECPRGDVFWSLVSRNFIPCGSALFRRRCLADAGLLDEQVSGVDDWDLWVRISEIYPIIASDRAVMVWRRSTPVSAQGSSSADRMVQRAVRCFRERWMQLPRALRAGGEQRRGSWKKFSENMAEHLIWESARAAPRGQLIQAMRNLSNIARLHPLTLLIITRDRAFGVRRRPIEFASGSKDWFKHNS